MKQVLFLCSGNYYRSRMAQEIFNQRVLDRNLAWQADSLALRKDLHATGNRGPMSQIARLLLDRHGVAVRDGERMPRTLIPAELPRFERIIALSEREHRPMIEQLWPGVFDALQGATVEFWEVGDVGVDCPSQAVEKILHDVDAMIRTLDAIEAE